MGQYQHVPESACPRNSMSQNQHVPETGMSQNRRVPENGYNTLLSFFTFNIVILLCQCYCIKLFITFCIVLSVFFSLDSLVTAFTVDAVDMIITMFPPFPIPGFAPNFTGLDTSWHEVDWYEMYKFMAPSPNVTVMWVSVQCSYQLILNKVSTLK